ncbi:uncharacterized protein LOC117174570 [Belonocnema kinseyi]|uniref:uncharacterized protein LOC117174570 n=1 Tax=Belonocnema kinseyi TaxID=2817044 RepID=UPI00143DEEB6|nr:uncharacterized protein LOC117174570 [Belonocnema kinseyi]
MAATERTYLTRPTDPPRYVEFAGILRTRRNKIRQFQCCICACFLTLFVVTLVGLVSYSISQNPMNNLTTTTNLTSAPNLLKSSGLELDSVSSDVNPAFLTDEETIVGIEAGNEAIKSRRISDTFAKPLPSPSPDFRHQFAVSTSSHADELALAGIGEIAATRKIENSRSQLGKPSSMGSYFNGGWAREGSCKEFTKINCKPSKYRTYDGTCNNPNQWGSAMSPYRRILKPAYADGINSPRKSVSGEPLPSSREVSLKVHPPSPSANPSFTVMLAVFGQFLDHDMTATAVSQGVNGSSLSCCSPFSNHPECFPVEVGHGDPVYDVGGISCMEFVRSAPAPQCKIGPRQQLNQVTAFIDGSTIYGSDSQTAKSLREFQRGRLRMQVTSDNRTLLPRSTNINDGCNRELELKRGRYCFTAGDGRANENLHLTTMHVLWARQHNKLANRLAEINPSWDDEKLYQESRRIIGAQLQHIAYTEFVPIVLGETETNARKLRPLKSGFRKANMTVNPELANNFAASAFRFAHTLLPGLMKVTNAEKGTTSYVELHRMLFNPYSLYSQGGVSNSVTMATSNFIQQTSTHVTSQLTRHLFEDPSSNKTVPCGLDLVSLNVQRGRDHGLPGYSKWREYCGLKKSETFSDLNGDLDPDALDAISKLYSSVDDIDLYTGALAEVHKSDGIVGPTFTCLIGEQFERTQQGDTFWYENSNQPGSFTEDQLKELRKTSLAKLICDCSDDITKIQSEVMRSEKLNNPMISCEDLPGPSLEAWREDLKQTYEELSIEKPTEDWLAFKKDINNTVQYIVDIIKAKKPSPMSPEYIIFQKEINDSLTDFKNELTALHTQKTDSLNDIQSLNVIKTYINNSLEEANNQISLTAKKPSVIGDWVAFKTNIIKSLNDNLENFRETSSNTTDWLALKTKIKDQVQDIIDQVALIKNQIIDMKKNPFLQESINAEDTDWKNFRADIVKFVDEILDKIKDNMPSPEDPSWATYTRNIKNQFSNFKNQFKSLKSENSNEELLIKTSPDVFAKDESPEGLKFKSDLNETVDMMFRDIEGNAPPTGDPAWTDYKMKIMDKLSKFRYDIPTNSRVLIQMTQDGTVFDWMAFKADLNQSLSELFVEKKAGKLAPGDPRWAQFRNNFNKSMSSSKYTIAVLNLTLEVPSSADWKSFREDLMESIRDVVLYIKENAPPPGSPDWVQFRRVVRNRFAELRKQFDIRKSELLLKATADGTADEAQINATRNDTKNYEMNFNWVSFKADLNKTLLALTTENNSGKFFPSNPKWVEFKNEVNKSVTIFKNKVADLPPKPTGQELLRLRNDWADFSSQINKSLADAIRIFDNKAPPGDPDWKSLRDSLKNNFAEVRDEIAEIRVEWLSKLKEDAIGQSENELESLQATTKKSFSDLKTRIENLKLDPIPFDITDVNWILFKETINKTVMDYINSINRSDSEEWVKFRDMVDRSVTDLKYEVDALRNLIDEALKKTEQQKNCSNSSKERWTNKMEMNDTMTNSRKKVADLKSVDDLKWNEYRNSVKRNFKELHDSINSKKLKLNLLQSSGTRVYLTFFDRMILVRFVLIATLVTL